MLYFPTCICIYPYIPLNRQGNDRHEICNTKCMWVSKTSPWEHKARKHQGGSNQSSALTGFQWKQKLESGACTEACSAISDTLGYLKTDVTQQHQLNAKHDVLVHLKEPSLGNQNYPR